MQLQILRPQKIQLVEPMLHGYNKYNNGNTDTRCTCSPNSDAHVLQILNNI